MSLPAPFHCAIFDMDGTVLDSMPVWDTLGEDYLRSLGRPVPPGLRGVLGAPLHAADRELSHGPAAASPARPSGSSTKSTRSWRTSTETPRPQSPGAAELLSCLRARGVRLALATATDRPLAEAALRRTGLLPYFSCLLTCSEVGAGKDRPDIYFAALAALSAKREETLVFEDAVHAIETAKAAGLCPWRPCATRAWRRRRPASGPRGPVSGRAERLSPALGGAFPAKNAGFPCVPGGAMV